MYMLSLHLPLKSAIQPFDENMEFIPLEQRHPDVLLFRGLKNKNLTGEGNKMKTLLIKINF